MKKESFVHPQRASPPLFPSFYRTNNSMSSYLLPNDPQLDGLLTHRRQCLVLPPKQPKCEIVRKNNLYHMLYDHVPATQSPHRSGIVTIDFDDTTNQRMLRYIKREVQQVTKKRESRSSTHQPETQRYTNYPQINDASALTRKLINQRQLSTRKKHIDMAINSAIYERQRFRSLIQKDKEERQLRKQKSIERAYINPKTLHERLQKKRHRYPSFWCEEDTPRAVKQQARDASATIEEDLRPWTNSLAQAQQQGA